VTSMNSSTFVESAENCATNKLCAFLV
jgi:hypothetical protein